MSLPLLQIRHCSRLDGTWDAWNFHGAGPGERATQAHDRPVLRGDRGSGLLVAVV